MRARCLSLGGEVGGGSRGGKGVPCHQLLAGDSVLTNLQCAAGNSVRTSLQYAAGDSVPH